MFFHMAAKIPLPPIIPIQQPQKFYNNSKIYHIGTKQNSKLIYFTSTHFHTKLSQQIVKLKSKTKI